MFGAAERLAHARTLNEVVDVVRSTRRYRHAGYRWAAHKQQGGLKVWARPGKATKPAARPHPRAKTPQPGERGRFVRDGLSNIVGSAAPDISKMRGAISEERGRALREYSTARPGVAMLAHDKAAMGATTPRRN